METAVKNLYEAMFLVDSALATSDWDSVTSAIEDILKRADADVVSLKKWAERKLAYEIKQKSRGTYILCYFRANGQRISQIERALQLSEKFMRVLILNAEKRSIEDIEKESVLLSEEKKETPESVAGQPETEQHSNVTKESESIEKTESEPSNQEQESKEAEANQQESKD